MLVQERSLCLVLSVALPESNPTNTLPPAPPVSSLPLPLNSLPRLQLKTFPLTLWYFQASMNGILQCERKNCSYGMDGVNFSPLQQLNPVPCNQHLFPKTFSSIATFDTFASLTTYASPFSRHFLAWENVCLFRPRFTWSEYQA